MIFFDSCSTVACRVGASQPDCRGHSSSRQLCSLHSPSRCRCSAALLTCSLLAGWGLLLLGADWFAYFVLSRYCCLIVRVLFSVAARYVMCAAYEPAQIFCSAIIVFSDCIHSSVIHSVTCSDFCSAIVVFCSFSAHFLCGVISSAHELFCGTELILLMSNCWSGNFIYMHIWFIYWKEPVK